MHEEFTNITLSETIFKLHVVVGEKDSQAPKTITTIKPETAK